ncbi:MAG: hypothetical protein AAFQ63_09125 [Cyanobacteria bacterium J06621_11]
MFQYSHGVIRSPRRWLRASIAGAIAGGGAFIGLVLYIFLRAQLFDSGTFFHLEFIIGLTLGAIPGILLFIYWVKPPRPKAIQQDL